MDYPPEHEAARERYDEKTADEFFVQLHLPHWTAQIWKPHEISGNEGMECWSGGGNEERIYQGVINCRWNLEERNAGLREFEDHWGLAHAAEWNSAIQQSATLRYIAPFFETT